MNAAQSAALRDVLTAQPIAALGTLHDGRPAVSMAPYAALADGSGLVVHVSALASHTRDMLSNPDVSLLIMAPPLAGVMPQATARVAIEGTATQCERSSEGYVAARGAYLERFPQSEGFFDLGDFSLFVIRPTSARFVGGFAQAVTVSAESLAVVLAEISQAP